MMQHLFVTVNIGYVYIHIFMDFFRRSFFYHETCRIICSVGAMDAGVVLVAVFCRLSRTQHLIKPRHT